MTSDLCPAFERHPELDQIVRCSRPGHHPFAHRSEDGLVWPRRPRWRERLREWTLQRGWAR